MSAGTPGRAARPRSLLDLLIRHRADPLRYLERCAREDGDVVVFELAGRRLLVINSPILAQEILVRRHGEFWKAHVFETETVPWGRAILGHGLLVSEGESWLRQRRLMQQAFHRARIEAYAGIADDLTRRLITRWTNGEPRDIHTDMSTLTLEILARALFGDVGRVRDLHDALRAVFGRREPTRGLLYLIPEWIPTQANRTTRRALRELDEILMRSIAARRSRADAGSDLLGLLLSARDDHGGGFDDRFVRDELVSTIVAGQDTLAATLTWSLDTLADRPAVVERMRSELAAAPADLLPVGEDLHRFPYLSSVVKEILRLFPPGKNIARVAAVDCDLAGLPVERGTSVIVSQWVIHRDERWYRDPGRFEPDRWTADLERDLPRLAFFPFGGGPRLCLGFAFAEMGLQVVMSSLIRAFDLTGPAEGRRWDMARLRPSRGMWLTPSRAAA